MASFTLNWTPAGGAYTTGQKVNYRLKGDTVWITFATIGATTNSSTITGLTDNEIYEFQIVNICSVGGDTPSATIELIVITCPTVTYTNAAYNSIDYSFTALGADIVNYDVQLLNAAGTVIVATQTKATAATVTGSFTGLTAATSYNLRAIPKTTGDTFTKTNCALVPASSLATPTCNTPAGLSVTIS